MSRLTAYVPAISLQTCEWVTIPNPTPSSLQQRTNVLHLHHDHDCPFCNGSIKSANFSGPPPARNLIFSLRRLFLGNAPFISRTLLPHMTREGHTLTLPLFPGMRSY